MADAILELDRLTKRFGRTVTADRLSLTVSRGEFFTFLGPSGSGKSTILRMIAGLVAPDSGRIEIDGKDVARMPPWRRNLGMMFQQYAVFPHMNVSENIGYGLKVRGVPRAEISRRVTEMVDLVGLAGLADKSVSNLSGGEQQRVALARALAPRRACFCSMSRFPRSTRRFAGPCRSSSPTFTRRPARHFSMSPMIRRKP